MIKLMTFFGMLSVSLTTFAVEHMAPLSAAPKQHQPTFEVGQRVLAPCDARGDLPDTATITRKYITRGNLGLLTHEMIGFKRVTYQLSFDNKSCTYGEELMKFYDGDLGKLDSVLEFTGKVKSESTLFKYTVGQKVVVQLPFLNTVNGTIIDLTSSGYLKILTDNDRSAETARWFYWMGVSPY